MSFTGFHEIKFSNFCFVSYILDKINLLESRDSMKANDAVWCQNDFGSCYESDKCSYMHGFVQLCSGGFWGTAVCTFSLATIEYVFARSPFKAQRTFESNWRPLPDGEVPYPRPGQVSRFAGRLLFSRVKTVRSMYNCCESNIIHLSRHRLLVA